MQGYGSKFPPTHCNQDRNWGVGCTNMCSILHNEFLFKSVVIMVISKEISRAENEYMNIRLLPPPPFSINFLAPA